MKKLCLILVHVVGVTAISLSSMYFAMSDEDRKKLKDKFCDMKKCKSCCCDNCAGKESN